MPALEEMVMAGLYDGLEEVAFKPIAGGYVFQANNPWLIGPRRRYFVNEAQKADIAACVRETLKRLKPFVLAAAILIPVIMVGSIFWFATSGATLIVTITEESGQTTTYNQPIGPHGSTGTLEGAEGSSVVFRVSGPPGGGATVTINGIASTGKAGAPCVLQFGSGGTTINMADSKNHTVRSARLVARTGAAPRAVMVFAVLVSLGLFGLYIGLIHVYSMSRLRPLLAGLQPSDERITLGEGMQRYGANMSNKLLALMAFGGMMMSAGSALNLTDMILTHRSTDTLPFVIVTAVASLVVLGHVAYLVLVKVRARNAGRSAIGP
jgi:hypothetical protein